MRQRLPSLSACWETRGNLCSQPLNRLISFNSVCPQLGINKLKIHVLKSFNQFKAYTLQVEFKMLLFARQYLVLFDLLKITICNTALTWVPRVHVGLIKFKTFVWWITGNLCTLIHCHRNMLWGSIDCLNSLFICSVVLNEPSFSLFHLFLSHSFNFVELYKISV